MVNEINTKETGSTCKEGTIYLSVNGKQTQS